MSGDQKHRRGAVRWVGLGVALGLLTLGGRAHAAPSPVVYPERPYGLPFRHAPHSARCLDCHAPTEGREEPGLPSPELCQPCHPLASDPPRPISQPSGPATDTVARELPQPVPETWLRPGPEQPRLRFRHAQHGGPTPGCAGCHPLATEQTSRPFPLMQQCRSCHASARCAVCHPILPDGTLQTRFGAAFGVGFGPRPTGLAGWLPDWRADQTTELRPRGPALGASHEGSWARTHGRAAVTEAELCQACHRASWCRQCHQGRFLPSSQHPATWSAEHGAAARLEGNRCQSCHRFASFCSACHQRVGLVAPGEPASRPLPATARFHPPGWATLTLTPNEHGPAARRSMGTCIGCHREETCLRCHRSRSLDGPGFPIHPAAMTERCQELLRANPATCLRCHRDSLRRDPRCR